MRFLEFANDQKSNILLEFPYKLRSTSELFTVLHNDLMVLLLHSNDRSNIKSLANNYFKCVDRQSGKTYYWYMYKLLWIQIP